VVRSVARGVVVLAEDDPATCKLAEMAVNDIGSMLEFNVVQDGQELMEYLRQQGEHGGARRPHLILLDLNMPRKNGFEALSEIRDDDGLKDLPVVILTTSDSRGDIMRCYKMGANSFVTKPTGFSALQEMFRSLEHYWFDTVTVPTG
jgi:CheY-like chemotaxis protein